MPNNQKASEVQLVPPDEFRNALGQVLNTSKKESDKQLAKLQASNARKREAKK